MQHTVNLMPLAFRRRQSTKRILCGWALVGFLTCITMLTLWIGQGDDTVSLSLAALERQSGPIVAMQQRTITLNKEFNQLRQQSELLDRLRPHDDVLQTIGAVAIVCSSKDQSIRVQTLELSFNDKERLQSEKSNSNSKTPTADSSPNPPKLIMQLHAEEEQAISEVVNQLEKNPRFRRIELMNASGTRDASARIVELHSELHVSEPAQ